MKAKRVKSTRPASKGQQGTRTYWTGALTMLIGLLAAAYIFPRVQPAAAAEAPPPSALDTAHALTPTPAPTPYGRPAETEQILALAEKLLTLTESLMESGELQGPTIYPVVETKPEPTPTPPPWAEEHLLVSEDVGCVTPANVPYAHLCGGGDGYVVRWRNTVGDNSGGKTPSADFMAYFAVGLAPSTLVWDGRYPATGELAQIHYLRGDRSIQLSVGGRVIYRVDSAGRYTRLMP